MKCQNCSNGHQHDDRVAGPILGGVLDSIHCGRLVVWLDLFLGKVLICWKIFADVCVCVCVWGGERRVGREEGREQEILIGKSSKAETACLECIVPVAFC